MEPNKILVIDDQPGIREACKKALAPRGYHVQVAETGEEGLQKIYSEGFDLVLIDMMMPGTSGMDLIPLIRQRDPDCVCTLTGYAAAEMTAAAIKQGVYDILTKPFTTDELYLVVRQGLERRRLALEVKRLQAIEVEVQRLAQEKARLEELDKAKVAFNRLVTHELQAPVSAVLSYLDLMLKNYIPPEKQREYLERAASRVKGLMALIGDSIEFSRLKDGRTASKPEFIQMESILSQVIAQYENQAAEKKVTIHANISTGIAPICMIEDQARSIWTNLISNGIKYTPEGGRILIILRQAEASLIGQVIDTGIGIPEDAKGRLFMEFFRAGNAKSLNIPGSGLGLAIVKQIIDKAGGNIWVESTMGKGSTFSFSLPITNS